MSDDYLIIGHTCGIYGLKGWVKVKAFTQSQDSFLAYKDCFISREKTNAQSWQAVKIEQGKIHGKGLVARFSGFEDRTAVEKFGKFYIAVKRSILPELDDDSFYWHQLEGLEVWSTYASPESAATDEQQNKRVLLGKVHHLLETGSNDVLVVQTCSGSLDDKERLLPYRPEVVLSVDLKSASMEVDWDPDF